MGWRTNEDMNADTLAQQRWEARHRRAGWICYLTGQEFYEDLNRIQNLIGSICYESAQDIMGDWWIRRVN